MKLQQTDGEQQPHEDEQQVPQQSWRVAKKPVYASAVMQAL